MSQSASEGFSKRKPEDSERVDDELSALRAIYGDDHVSYFPPTGALSIRLPEAAGSGAFLSCLLPSGYPSSERPRNPTLRGYGLCASECSAIVSKALCNVMQSNADGVVDGEFMGECLFEYCQAITSCRENFVADRRVTEIAKSDADDAECDVPSPSLTSFPSLPSFEIVHGEPLTDRKSVFQAHAAYTDSLSDALNFVGFLRHQFPKIATATHNVMAYRIGAAQDYDDDGEHAAGKSLLFTLQQQRADNVVVVVSRWYGGIKLGPVRFKHINNVARSLLVSHQSGGSATSR